MIDSIEQILETSPTHLAGIFALGSESSEWTLEEMRDGLDHLLTIPFETALSQLPPDLATKLRDFAGKLQVHAVADLAHVSTFGELFQHPEPPIVVLKFAKEFGKAILAHGTTVWPAQIGAVVYYSSLGVALVHHGKSIGRLSREELNKGFTKLLALPCLDELTTRIFREARDTLRRG